MSVIGMKEIFKHSLQQIKKVWLLFVKVLVKVNTFILLSLVYIFIVGIISLIAKILRKDFLQRKMSSHQATCWHARISSEPTLDRHKFQF
jgi:hypothetical protein